MMYAVRQNRPQFSVQEAVRLAREIFGVEATGSELSSERDQNFRLWSMSGDEFVLKIASAAEKREVLDFQNKAMEHLGRNGIPCPRVCRSLSGSMISEVCDAGGAVHFVRMLTYLRGVFFSHVRPHSPELLENLGRFFGAVDKALDGFSHPAANRELVWEMRTAASVIRRCKEFIEDKHRLAIVERYLERFEREGIPSLPALRTSVIHNDGNDYNLLVNPIDPKQSENLNRQIVGIIDFGDMLHSITAADPAIAAAYALLGKDNPLSAAARVISGYHEVFPLTDLELEVLFHLVCIRLTTSVALSAYQQKQEPLNRYLSISEKPAWDALEKLSSVHPRFAGYTFRNSCKLPPCPRTGEITAWLNEHSAAAASVVACDLRSDPKVVFDLSVASPLTASVSAEVPAGANPMQNELARCSALSDLLFGAMKKAGVRVGIGRYNEARSFYATDLYKRPSDGVPETRTVHIGIDLFMQAGSQVYAPLDGSVHSFQDNDQLLDYGPTIILRHEMGNGSGAFFTLYGHLGRESLDTLREGMLVQKGQPIGTIGNYPENGCWPPHVHFEIIADLLDRSGEFPGVAAPSERDVWLSLCPDPNLILGIPATDFPARNMSEGEIVAMRKHKIGRNLSISYRRPLHIVRGYMQHLYDQDGRPYLDAVNNVPHVGHCHPRVVKASQQQTAVLNTNTRYLHGNIVKYAERLCSKLPEPLRVCFFVSSGSEANDLALRLARAHTGRLDTVVVDGAYHGNLTSLIEISPYKFDGPGGGGAPLHVHKVPTPDPYRGKYRKGESDIGARYAGHVREAIESMTGKGRDVAAFICEPALSCAGQIVPPEGYLREAYRHIRKAGGVCIADEVQVGFGRMGACFWGFETQGVVPDIVTMGKPIGNGHPLAAVVTTPEIAASFDNGMEYFSTYGGNPVSCAVGLAVLDVIESEKLQANALNVGARLKQSLGSLMLTHPIVGDVRGEGLFLGVELVLDRTTLEPAAEHASYIAERMKDLGILISTDGPLHNVLKIKPPLVFRAQDADFLTDTLDKVLHDDFCRL